MAKKTHAMDQHLQSTEKWELSYWKRKWGVGAKDIRAAIKAVGHSRDVIMKHLIETGKVKTVIILEPINADL